jgi:hypothetical protein
MVCIGMDVSKQRPMQAARHKCVSYWLHMHLPRQKNFDEIKNEPLGGEKMFWRDQIVDRRGRFKMLNGIFPMRG